MYETIFPPQNPAIESINFAKMIVGKIVQNIFITQYDRMEPYWKEWAPLFYILARYFNAKQTAQEIGRASCRERV